MMTATEASKFLGVSRNTFYLRVKDLDIELVKEGRSSLIQPDDVKRIMEALGTKRKHVSSVIGRNARTSDIGHVGHPSDSRQEVIDELRGQNDFFKSQLQSEKDTSAKLLDQMQQSQQLMVSMQTETLRLRQENQQLKLEYQPPAQKNEALRGFEDVADIPAEFTEATLEPEAIPNAISVEHSDERIERVLESGMPAEFAEATWTTSPIGDSGARAFGIVALVALAALVWVTITNTELPLREAIASFWKY